MQCSLHSFFHEEDYINFGWLKLAKKFIKETNIALKHVLFSSEIDHLWYFFTVDKSIKTELIRSYSDVQLYKAGIPSFSGCMEHKLRLCPTMTVSLPLAFKIQTVHLWVRVDVCAKFEEDLLKRSKDIHVHKNGVESIRWTDDQMTLTFDLWPPKSDQPILGSGWTCVQGLMKIQWRVLEIWLKIFVTEYPKGSIWVPFISIYIASSFTS